MRRKLWNFEPAFGRDILGAFRVEYLRPMHWEVWEAPVECPTWYECVVEGSLDELNFWAIGMHHDGRLEVLESIGIQLSLDPVEKFLGVRPNARVIAIGSPATVPQETPPDPEDSKQLVYVFAEPCRGHSLAVWSLLRGEHDEEIGDCDILSSGATSIEEVVDLVMGINGEVTTLHGNALEQMFVEMRHEHANFVRALAM